MSSHDLVQRFAQLCTDHDVDGFGEVIAEDYIQHNPTIPDGLTAIRNGFVEFLRVFPDLTAGIEAVVAEGDLVVARFRWEGTHSESFLGIPASGRYVSWQSTDWWRIEQGKLAEHWDVIDWAGLSGQLSVESGNRTA